MRRRSFFKIVASSAAATVLPWPVNTCRWAHDHCAPHPPDQFYVTECGKDFLTVNGTREKNEFWFCPYCGGTIAEMKLKTGGLCGRQILDNLHRSRQIR